LSDEIRLIPEGSDRATRCRHFNGTVHDRCEAGMVYLDVRLEHEPIRYRHARQGEPSGSTYTATASFPCLGKFNHGGATCPRYEPFTPEEVAASQAAHRRTMDLMERGLSSCCEAPIDESRVIRRGRHEGHGPRYCSKCGRCVFIV
jgi:hypothetical protein